MSTKDDVIQGEPYQATIAVPMPIRQREIYKELAKNEGKTLENWAASVLYTHYSVRQFEDDE